MVIARRAAICHPTYRKRHHLGHPQGDCLEKCGAVLLCHAPLGLPILKLVGRRPSDRCQNCWRPTKRAAIWASDKLLGAIKTIIVADFVMSIDGNVIGIAGAAQGARVTRASNAAGYFLVCWSVFPSSCGAAVLC